MACFDLDDPGEVPPSRASANGNGPERLPGSARRTLDQIAEALGVAATLLSAPVGGASPAGDAAGPSGEAARLMEATALLQAFVRIEDPEVRRGLLAKVREAASAT